VSRNAQAYRIRPAPFQSKFAGAALLALAAAGLACGAEPEPSTVRPPQRARVVIVEDARATGTFVPKPEVVRSLVERGLRQWTGRPTTTAAWLSFVSTNDFIGLKVYSAPGATGGSRPEVAAAVASTLIAAGVPAGQIIVWDKHAADLRLAGFTALRERLGVRVESALDAGWDEKAAYDRSLIGSLVFGDLEFGRKGDNVGRKSHLSRLITKTVTKHISIAPLLNHNQMGVCGHLQSLALGAADNTIRFENHPAHLFEAVAELYAMPELGDRVVLNITDALLCQHEGEQRPLLHYSVALNQLRFSSDPVALDILSLEELQRQRRKAGFAAAKVSLAMFRNASLLELGISEPANIRIEWAK